MVGKDRHNGDRMTLDPKEKSLDRYLDVIYHNQKANRIRFPEWHEILLRIDRCFVLSCSGLTDPKPVMTSQMLLRSQYAYKAAAGMTLAGQIAESFAMMRCCLEYAGYGLTIFHDWRVGDARALEQVFVNRHNDDASMREQRREFKISNVRESIALFDRTLADVFQTIYDRTVSFGGHPNPFGMLSAMNLEENEHGLTSITGLALVTDPTVMGFALKSVAQVGLTALCILEHAYKERFESLGIRAELDDLKQTGL